MGLKEKLRLFAGYFFRWVGFPVEPGLIKVGNPGRDSPVLVTCNFNLTVKRVLNALDGIDCYLLVAPSKGINVWCGACGDDFTTDSVISVVKTSGIEDLVDHRTLVLPQLGAPGIDPVSIKEQLGWNARFGPVYAKDIKAYIENGYQKTPEMRVVTFPVSKRVEMANLYFFSLVIPFSAGFWLVSAILQAIDVFLYLSMLATATLVNYGAFMILPVLRGKTGWPKILVHAASISILMLVLYLVSWINVVYLAWNLVIIWLFALFLMEDFNGLTPIYKSELGERSWRKGQQKMKFMLMEFKLQPYGDILLDRDKCIGCKVCIEVCPRNLYRYNEKDRKVDLVNKGACINCNACVKRCLAGCIEIA